jgi:hypothetical protein
MFSRRNQAMPNFLSIDTTWAVMVLPSTSTMLVTKFIFMSTAEVKKYPVCRIATTGCDESLIRGITLRRSPTDEDPTGICSKVEFDVMAAELASISTEGGRGLITPSRAREIATLRNADPMATSRNLR